MFTRPLLPILFFLLFSSATLYAAPQLNDHDALSGLKTVKVIFDVRVPDSDKLVFNLELFAETRAGLIKQGVTPEMVVAFRGPGVKLLSRDAIDEEVQDLIQDMQKKGVRFEVCAVAVRTFKADPGRLIPEVKLVANGFNSLIGYQNKGYAMIAIN
jgi:intracellular sulfur oxidation DsrE/DsrF family protein